MRSPALRFITPSSAVSTGSMFSRSMGRGSWKRRCAVHWRSAATLERWCKTGRIRTRQVEGAPLSSMNMLIGTGGGFVMFAEAASGAFRSRDHLRWRCTISYPTRPACGGASSEWLWLRPYFSPRPEWPPQPLQGSMFASRRWAGDSSWFPRFSRLS